MESVTRLSAQQVHISWKIWSEVGKSFYCLSPTFGFTEEQNSHVGTTPMNNGVVFSQREKQLMMKKTSCVKEFSRTDYESKSVNDIGSFPPSPLCHLIVTPSPVTSLSPDCHLIFSPPLLHCHFRVSQMPYSCRLKQPSNILLIASSQPPDNHLMVTWLLPLLIIPTWLAGGRQNCG